MFENLTALDVFSSFVISGALLMVISHGKQIYREILTSVLKVPTTASNTIESAKRSLPTEWTALENINWTKVMTQLADGMAKDGLTKISVQFGEIAVAIEYLHPSYGDCRAINELSGLLVQMSLIEVRMEKNTRLIRINPVIINNLST